jgi:hypothetical protein
MTIRDGMVHVHGGAGGTARVTATFDDRQRVQVPYGLRTMVGFHPGMRVLVVTVPAEGSVSILPVQRVLAAFGADR